LLKANSCLVPFILIWIWSLDWNIYWQYFLFN